MGMEGRVGGTALGDKLTGGFVQARLHALGYHTLQEGSHRPVRSGLQVHKDVLQSEVCSELELCQVPAQLGQFRRDCPCWA